MFGRYERNNSVCALYEWLLLRQFPMCQYKTIKIKIPTTNITNNTTTTTMTTHDTLETKIGYVCEVVFLSECSCVSDIQSTEEEAKQQAATRALHVIQQAIETIEHEKTWKSSCCCLDSKTTKPTPQTMSETTISEQQQQQQQQVKNTTVSTVSPTPTPIPLQQSSQPSDSSSTKIVIPSSCEQTKQQQQQQQQQQLTTSTNVQKQPGDYFVLVIDGENIPSMMRETFFPKDLHVFGFFAQRHNQAQKPFPHKKILVKSSKKDGVDMAIKAYVHHLLHALTKDNSYIRVHIMVATHDRFGHVLAESCLMKDMPWPNATTAIVVTTRHNVFDHMELVKSSSSPASCSS